MENWQKWYYNFLENKKSKELEAFAKGLNGEKFEPKLEPSFNKNTDWNTLISIVNDKNYDPKYSHFDFELTNGKLNSSNPLIPICFSKSIRNYSNYGTEQTLFYLIVSHLNKNEFDNLSEILKFLREIPEDLFLVCNNCGTENSEGWIYCKNCNISIDNSFDN